MELKPIGGIAPSPENIECSCKADGVCAPKCNPDCDSAMGCTNTSLPDIQISPNINPANVEIQIYRNRSVMEAYVIFKDTGETIDRLPVQWKSRQNALDYLSVSKIGAYEQCPSSFYKTYMQNGSEYIDSGNFYTKFGSILHDVAEHVDRYYTENGIVVNPESIFEEEWQKYDLTDFDAYLEGKQLIKDYYRRNPVDKDAFKSVMIEHEWRGELGGCTFGLIFDNVGIAINNDSVARLKDYKTNRIAYTPAELASSFQLRIYTLVLKRHFFPEIKRWIAGYEMFRFGWQECPEWTDDDLLDAEQYVTNIWAQITNDNTWKEELNKYCAYRECRFTCKTYADFLNNPHRYCEHIALDGMDFTAIDKQRELMSTIEKSAKNRKDECATILKTAIEESLKQGKPFIIDGQELQLYSSGKSSYNYYDTRNVLLTQGNLGILDDCLTVNKTKFEKKISARPELKLALAGCTNTSYAAPYIVKRKANK